MVALSRSPKMWGSESIGNRFFIVSLDVAMAECRPLVSHNVTNSAPIDRSARRNVIDSEYFIVPFRAFSRRSVDLDILVMGLVNVVLVN